MPTGTLTAAPDEWLEIIPVTTTPFAIDNQGAAAIMLVASVEKPTKTIQWTAGRKLKPGTSLDAAKITDLVPGAPAGARLWAASILGLKVWRSVAD